MVWLLIVVAVTMATNGVAIPGNINIVQCIHYTTKYLWCVHYTVRYVWCVHYTVRYVWCVHYTVRYVWCVHYTEKQLTYAHTDVHEHIVLET